MSRKCIASFTGYHKTTLKKVVFKPHDTSISPSISNSDILTTSSRDGAIYIWDLRCTGIVSPVGPRYKPIASILGGHPVARGRKTGEMVQGSAITGLAWAGDNIVSACDANSYVLSYCSNKRVIKIWDPRKLNALSTKTPISMETSLPPESHHLRPYGITSIATQNNRIFALSKDSRYHHLSIVNLVSTHTTQAICQRHQIYSPILVSVAIPSGLKLQ
jgi:WD40 repeat protein